MMELSDQGAREEEPMDQGAATPGGTSGAGGKKNCFGGTLSRTRGTGWRTAWISRCERFACRGSMGGSRGEPRAATRERQGSAIDQVPGAWP